MTDKAWPSTVVQEEAAGKDDVELQVVEPTEDRIASERRVRTRLAVTQWKAHTVNARFKLVRTVVNIFTKVTVKYIFALQLIAFIGMSSNILFQAIFSLSVPILASNRETLDTTVPKLVALTAVLLYSLVMLPAVLDQVFDAVADTFSGDASCFRIVHGTPPLRYMYKAVNRRLSRWFNKEPSTRVLSRVQFVQAITCVPAVIFGIIFSSVLGGPLSGVLTVALAMGALLVTIHIVTVFLRLVVSIPSFGGLVYEIPAVWRGLRVAPPKRREPVIIPQRAATIEDKLKALDEADNEEFELQSPREKLGRVLVPKMRVEMSLVWRGLLYPLVRRNADGSEDLSGARLTIAKTLCFVTPFMFLLNAITALFMPLETATCKWASEKVHSKTNRNRAFVVYGFGVCGALAGTFVMMLTLIIYIGQFSSLAAISVAIYLTIAQPILFATVRKFQADGYSFRKFMMEAGMPIFFLFAILALIGMLYVVLLAVQEDSNPDVDNAAANAAAYGSREHWERMARLNEVSIDDPAFNTTLYAICDMDWEGLNIVDLSLSAMLSYYTDLDSFEYAFNLFLNETGEWELSGKNNDSDIVKFYDLHNTEKDFHIMSVRGTASIADMVQDADLYFEVGLVQLFAFAFPFIYIMPENFLSTAVYAMSILEVKSSTEQRKYYANVEDYVNEYHSWSGPNHAPVIFTGHSLGGAVAKIVAVNTNHTAVVFNSPGLVLSREKFGVDRKKLSHSVVNVKPRADLVSKVDELAGLIQKIECDAGFGLLQCHFLPATICELAKGCWDRRPYIIDYYCNGIKDLTPVE